MLLLSLAILLAPAAPNDWLDHIRLYLPLDGAHPVAWHGPARCEPMPFSRPSPALGDDARLVDNHVPRLVPGPAGHGIVYEGGQYTWQERGTTNWLSPAAALVDDTTAWSARGGAATTLNPTKVVGQWSLAVAVGAQLGGVRTGPVELQWPKVSHLASVYVRPLVGSPTVTLRVGAPSLKLSAESTSEPLGESWQRLQVRFDLPEQKLPDDLVLEVTAPAGARFLLDAAMLEQAAKYYHDRRSPSTWIPGRRHRFIEKTTYEVWPELFDPQAGTLALWVNPLPEVTNSTFVSLGSGWTVPFKLARDQNGNASAQIGSLNLRYGKVEPGQWTHLALTWDHGRAVAYRDGNEVGNGDYKPDSLPDLAAMIQAGYLLGIGHDDLGTFAHSIGANAALDELLLTDAPLPAELLAELVAAPAEVAATFAGPAVDLTDTRRAFGREETSAPLRFSLSAPVDRLTAKVDDRALAVLEHPQAGGIEVPFSPAGWLSGEHHLQLTLTAGGAMRTVGRALYVGPVSDPDRFQVLGWNVAPSQLAEFAAAGGTIANSGPNDHAAVQHRLAGLAGYWNYHNKSEPPPSAAMDEHVLNPDGTRGGVFLANPQVQARGLARARQDAEETLRYPSLRQVLLNTEWGVAINFSPAERGLAQRETGLDYEWWPLSDGMLKLYQPQEIEAAEAGLPEPAPPSKPIFRPFNLFYAAYLPPEFQPRDGAIALDNPLYRFTNWWQNERGLCAWNERLATAFRQTNANIAPFFDPILRGPTVKRYRSMALAQEWVYYENPLNMIPVQEALATICLGLPTQPTGMPQFLFKAGGAAPLSVTPPRDLVIESSWLCCSRPLAQMSYWGWQLVFPDEKMLTPAQASELLGGLSWDEAKAKLTETKQTGKHVWNPGAWEGFQALNRELFEPFGPLLKRWENAPRHLAIVKSLASELFSSERWWAAFEWGPAARGVTATGLPYDILYDDDLTPERLAQYDAVLLTGVDVLPRPALDAVRARATQALVVAGPAFAKYVPGAQVVESWDAPEVRRLLHDLAPNCLAWLPGQVPASVNALQLDGAQFVVAVNDQREFGPLLGQWQKVAETGVPQTVTVGLPEATAYYELTTSREARPDGGALRLDLPGSGGRIVACYPQRFGKLSVTCRELEDLPTAVRRFEVEVTVAAADGGTFTGPVPVRLDIHRPDGTLDDHSRSILVEAGRATVEMAVPFGQAGRWQVEATERLTGTRVQAEIER